MPKTSLNVDLHNAIPRATSNGETVWINTPVDPESPFENLITLFLSPDDALRLAGELKAHGEKAKRIADINREELATAV